MDHLPQRRRIRLPAEAYRRPGAFLVTIVVSDRRPLLGRCDGGRVLLSDLGEVVRGRLLEIPSHWPSVGVDEWIIMPDHLHAIVVLTRYLAAGLPQVIGTFKSASVKASRELHPELVSLWQRSFHDRTLRDDRALEAARRYVRTNPLRP